MAVFCKLSELYFLIQLASVSFVVTYFIIINILLLLLRWIFLLRRILRGGTQFSLIITLIYLLLNFLKERCEDVQFPFYIQKLFITVNEAKKRVKLVRRGLL